MHPTIRRGLLIIASLILTFAVLRVYLYWSPNTNLDIGSYNIHHLFTGLVLITLAAIPLALFQSDSLWIDLAATVFGIGLSMALDEWIYLIVTDGSDAAYLLPVSFWGGLIMVVGAGLYTAALILVWKRKRDAKTGK